MLLFIHCFMTEFRTYDHKTDIRFHQDGRLYVYIPIHVPGVEFEAPTGDLGDVVIVPVEHVYEQIRFRRDEDPWNSWVILLEMAGEPDDTGRCVIPIANLNGNVELQAIVSAAMRAVATPIFTFSQLEEPTEAQTEAFRRPIEQHGIAFIVTMANLSQVIREEGYADMSNSVTDLLQRLKADPYMYQLTHALSISGDETLQTVATGLMEQFKELEQLEQLEQQEG